MSKIKRTLSQLIIMKGDFFRNYINFEKDALIIKNGMLTPYIEKIYTISLLTGEVVLSDYVPF